MESTSIIVIQVKKWNKRAEVDGTGEDIGAEGPSAIIYIPAVIIVFIIFFYVAIQFIEIENVYSPKVKVFIESQKFFSNPECFAYTDPLSGRTYPYTISLDRFNDNVLNHCFDAVKGSTAYRLSIFDASNTQNRVGPTVATSNWKNEPPAMQQKYAVRLETNSQFQQGVIQVEAQT